MKRIFIIGIIGLLVLIFIFILLSKKPKQQTPTLLERLSEIKTENVSRPKESKEEYEIPQEGPLLY
jgi:hypothetical protein